MVIVSAMLVSALMATTTTARLQTTTSSRELALALAHELAHEIMQAEYEEPEYDLAVNFGLEPGDDAPPGTRTKYDDVDDYNGWISSPPANRSGAALSAGAEYERRVKVRFVDPNDVTGAGHTDLAADTGLKRIVVTVTGPSGVVSLVRLRSRNGTADREPSVEGTFIRWVGIELQLGADGRVMNSGTAVLNQSELETTP